MEYCDDSKDLNDAYIPMEKHASDNGRKTEESIRERFGLESEKVGLNLDDKSFQG